MNISRKIKGVTNRKLLELLVCPITGSALTYDARRQELISIKARVAYPIRSGVPIMLYSEARALKDDEIVGGRYRAQDGDEPSSSP